MRGQNTWHEEYFGYNKNKEFHHDYLSQYVTKEEESTQPNKFLNAKEKYKASEEVYSAALLDSTLLTKVIEDPGYKYLSEGAKTLIIASKLKTLRPLLVNACSASRKSELQGYEKELAQYEKAPSETNQTITQLSALNYTSKCVSTIGELNLWRLVARFSCISWGNIWAYLKSLGIIDAEGKLHGITVNIAMMDYPTQVFNALSVLIFAVKLLINATLPFKHAFAPTSRAELAFSPLRRFWMEIERDWSTYANDIFWMIFNGITNFPLLVGLSIPVANWILVGALFFDVAVLSIVLWKEDKKLADEIVWLYTEINAITNSSNATEKENTENAECTHHLHMYINMRKQAEIMRAGIRAKLIACILATALFITSLTLVLSLASPLMAPIGFIACVLAVAVILARNEIGKYAEAKAAQSVFKDQLKTKKARADKANAAGWQLAKSLSEFTFIPMLIVGLYTISFPAAVALTVVYIGVKVSGVKLTGPDNSPKALTLEEDETNNPLVATKRM